MIFDHEIGPYILYMDVLNNAFPLSFGSLAFSSETQGEEEPDGKVTHPTASRGA